MRRRILLGGVLLSALLATGRGFQLGVLQTARWRSEAYDQQGDTLTLTAPRGTIFDREGLPLAASHEVFRVALAPREVADRERVIGLLRRHLDMPKATAARYVTSKRTWIVLPGRYGVEVREALDRVAGIHFESMVQRFYPNGDVARELLGAVALDGVALGGLELEYDSILKGRAGRAVVRRDSRGRALPGSMLRAIEPVPGHDLYLTLDYDLQEIVVEALSDAIDRTRSAGGEMVLADPQTGEILAAVSRGRDERARNWRAVTEPYEPGSTLKPFTVAALLALGRAALTDSVHGENGRSERLRLSDVHAQGWMTMADALRESSNIGVAKLGERMERGEQYVALRDFGFGTPTGVRYPSESAGRLPRPRQWSATSPSRLSIGYEIAVTPLQMAMAYGALANGGLLFEPRLVREVRSRDGRIQKRFEPHVVRQVIPEAVAHAVRDVLVDAVEVGTGKAAGLGPFEVAGKTGTVRVAANGRYRAGAYIASFAGFFPARDPQLVILVKLDEPQGEYYGGLAAAPVTRAALEAALAAHSTPIDRRAVAKPARPFAVVPSASGHSASRGARVVLLTSAPSGTIPTEPARDSAIALPDVAGMPMRDAVRRLHGAGFRLRVEGRGRALRTEPAVGAAAPRAALVRVVGEGL